MTTVRTIFRLGSEISPTLKESMLILTSTRSACTCLTSQRPLLFNKDNYPHYSIPGCTFKKSCRTFLQIPKLPNPLNILPGDKMQRYSERRRLGYSMKQMFDIVNDVEKYHLFVPHCKTSRVTKERAGCKLCLLEIGYPPLNEKYTSTVTYASPHLVESVCTDGKLFNHLKTTWRFSPGIPGKPDTCIVDFSIAFEFRNAGYAALSNAVFDTLVKSNVGAFQKRAAKIYGPPSITAKKLKTLKMDGT